MWIRTYRRGSARASLPVCVLVNQTTAPSGHQGSPTYAQGPRFDRDTGVGYVAAHGGDYRDAISKGNTVNLCVIETSGAVNATTERVSHTRAR